MTFFGNDVWYVRDLDLPENRVNHKIVHFDFIPIIGNLYNNLAIKQFIHSQIKTTKLHIGTIYKKQRVILRFLIYLGSKKLDEVSLIDVETYLFSFNDKAEETFNAYMSCLGEFFEYCIMRGYCSDNFFDDIGHKKLKPKPPIRIKAIDNKVISKILSGLNELPLKIQIMFFILFTTAMRIRHMLSLEKDCVYIENGRYLIKSYNPEYRIFESSFIAKELYLLIQKYIDEEARENTSKYLFPHSTDINRPDTGWILNDRLKKILINSELSSGEELDFHLSYLRHHLVFKLLSMGISFPVIMRVLKNNSTSMADIYLYIFSDEKLKRIKEYQDKHGNTLEVLLTNNTNIVVNVFKILEEDMSVNILPNGVCLDAGLSGKLCSHCNACLGCSYFVTGKEHEEVHVRQLHETSQQLIIAEKNGYTQEISKLRETKASLEKIISNFKRSNNNENNEMQE